MPHALIVAHGQPSDPAPAEASLAAFASRVQAEVADIPISSATLAAPGRLEEVLQTLPKDAVVYPLFMAKGWFVTKALPNRMGNTNLTILDPLGTDPHLPELAARVLRAEAAERGWSIADTQILLAAHGSGRSRNPSTVALDFAKKLQTILGTALVTVGFVEEAPSIEAAARPLGRLSLCLPFFACQGGHASEDVPHALNQAQFQGALLPVLGELPPIPGRIAERVRAHYHV